MKKHIKLTSIDGQPILVDTCSIILCEPRETYHSRAHDSRLPIDRLNEEQYEKDYEEWLSRQHGAKTNSESGSREYAPYKNKYYTTSPHKNKPLTILHLNAHNNVIVVAVTESCVDILNKIDALHTI